MLDVRIGAVALWFERRGMLSGGALLFLAAFLLFLPLLSVIPPIDRDEVLFAQAARQMAGSGDIVDIRFGEEARYKKPIGIYWLQAASARLTGVSDQMWVYRLPSALAAALSVALTWAIGRTLAGARAGLVAAVLFGATLMIGAEARLAKTDATLLATVLLAQLGLARLWTGGTLSRAGAAGFWAALGASVLVKGPIGPMVLALTVGALALRRRGVAWLAPLRPRAGLAVLLAIVLPWYLAITLKSGAAFWDEALGRDLLGKIGEGQESHGAPPGAYLAALWITFWPAAIVLPAAVAGIAGNWRREEIWFCLAWLLPTWIVFELIATKLVHYVMPAYPALAILAAIGWLGRDGAPGLPMRVVATLLTLPGLALIAVPLVYGGSVGAGPSLVWGLGAALALAATWLCLRAIHAGRRLEAVAAMPLMSLGVVLAVFGHFSRVDYLWPARAVEAVAAAPTACSDPVVRTVGYGEPSLVFRTGDWRIVSDPDAIAGDLAGADCALVFVEDRVHDATMAALDAAGWVTEAGPVIAGMDLGRGRDIRLTAYTLQRWEIGNEE